MTDSAGVIQIKLISYENIFSRKSGNPDQCCDVMSTDPLQCRSAPCDPFFDFCLQNMTHSGCGLGRDVTGYTRNQDNIRFGNNIGHNNTGNPLRFPVSQFFDNQLILLVTVYDEDKLEGKQTNDRLDYMQQLISYTPDFNGTHKTTLNFTLSGKVSRVSIQVNIRCGTFFYGNDCAKRCRSDKRTYDCDSNGDKTCLPGWTGTTCATNVDECANNSCQNGATCKDGINNYICHCSENFTGNQSYRCCLMGRFHICHCSENFTGRYCESVITTSTPSPSTTTTTTVTSTVSSTLPVTSSPVTTSSMTSISQTTTSMTSILTTPTATTSYRTTDQHVNTTIPTTITISSISTKQSTLTTAVVTRSSTINSSGLTSKPATKPFSPKASHLGQGKMSEPEPGGGTPGPLIGGVFGGLAVVAASVVIGFFAYKRLNKLMETPLFAHWGGHQGRVMSQIMYTEDINKG